MIGEDADPDPDPALDPDPTHQVIGIEEEEIGGNVTEEIGIEVEATATGTDEEIVPDVETAKVAAGTVDVMIVEDAENPLETTVPKGMVASAKNLKVRGDPIAVKRVKRAKKSLITNQILKKKNKPR